MPGVRATFSHVASPCPMRNCSVSAGEQGDPATGSSLFRALELAGGTVPGAVEVEAWSSGGRSSEHLSLWDVGANPVLTGGRGGTSCRRHTPAGRRAGGLGPGISSLWFPRQSNLSCPESQLPSGSGGRSRAFALGVALSLLLPLAGLPITWCKSRSITFV